jgi:lipopolysaccharide/colanic/teichoic acid biosynthesis glycosyltransferase
MNGNTLISPKNEAVNELRWRSMKRVFDVSFTLLLYIFVLSWLFPVLIILQVILNPGPVFYRSKMRGKRGESFYCYKFRLMRPSEGETAHGVEDKNNMAYALYKILLQRFNFNKLPEFINVLKGEMSVVGPQLYDAHENIESNYEIKSLIWRNFVKPGLTGWTQVKAYHAEAKNHFRITDKKDYDLWYLEHWSFRLDIWIIFLTVRQILTR